MTSIHGEVPHTVGDEEDGDDETLAAHGNDGKEDENDDLADTYMDLGEDVEDRQEYEVNHRQSDDMDTTSAKALRLVSFFRLLFYRWPDERLRSLLKQIVNLLMERPSGDVVLEPLRMADLVIPALPELLGPTDIHTTRPLIAGLMRFASDGTPELEVASVLSEQRRVWRRAILLVCLFRCELVRELFFTDNPLSRTVFHILPPPRHVYLPFLTGIGPLVSYFQTGDLSPDMLVERACSLWLVGSPHPLRRRLPLPDDVLAQIEAVRQNGGRVPPHASAWAT